MEANYNIVLVWPYINMNPPQVYTCSPSWISFPPSSPYHPSGSSQCTSPEHPVSCIKPGLAIRFTYDIIHVSMPFSQIIPPSPSPTESKRLFYTSVSLYVFSFTLFIPPLHKEDLTGFGGSLGKWSSKLPRRSIQHTAGSEDSNQVWVGRCWLLELGQAASQQVWGAWLLGCVCFTHQALPDTVTLENTNSPSCCSPALLTIADLTEHRCGWKCLWAQTWEGSPVPTLRHCSCKPGGQPSWGRPVFLLVREPGQRGLETHAPCWAK